MNVKVAKSVSNSSASHQFALNSEQRAIHDLAASFAEERIAPFAIEWDQKKHFPRDVIQSAATLGLGGICVAEDVGGSAMSRLEAVLIYDGLAAACPCIAGYFSVHNMVASVIDKHGNSEQRKQWLPQMCAFETLGAYCLSEPASGSDAAALTTRAVRDGDSYVVNGQKVWTSRALYSDLMLLLARTTPLAEVQRRSDGLSVFLVDLREVRGRGCDIRKIDAMVNHNTTEVFFSDMRIPANSLVGEEGKGFRHILDGMNAERILVSAEAIGNARWFVRRASEYASHRIVFDRPIGQNQGVQFPIARAYAETQAAELVLRQAAALFDAGLPCGEAANIGKLLASEAAWHAAEACMQTHGGFAAARDYDIERVWRETRIMTIAPISTNMVLSYIGEHVLGMPRSY